MDGQQDGVACYHDENNDEVRAAGNFGSRPFMILESSEPDRAPSPKYEKEIEAFNDYRFHQRLPRLASTDGRLVLLENPRAPETIIAAVRDVVTEVRATRKEQADDLNDPRTEGRRTVCEILFYVGSCHPRSLTQSLCS